MHAPHYINSLISFVFPLLRKGYLFAATKSPAAIFRANLNGTALKTLVNSSLSAPCKLYLSINEWLQSENCCR